MGSFDAGSISSELTLDRTRFNEELRAAKAAAQDFSRTKIDVPVRMETDDATARMAKLRTEFDALSKGVRITPTVDTRQVDDGLKRTADKAKSGGSSAGNSFVEGWVTRTKWGLLAPAAVSAVSGALALLPAVGGMAIAGMTGAMVAGLAMMEDKLNPTVAKAMQGLGTTAKAEMVKATQGLQTPIIHAIGELSSNLKSIEPELASLFNTATIGIQPMVTGITGFVDNLLPGLTSAIGQSGPILNAFADAASKAGTGIGNVLNILVQNAPAMAAAMTSVFSGLGRVVTGLAQAINNLVTISGPMLGTLFTTLGTTLGNALSTLGQALGTVVSRAGPVMNQFLQAFGQGLDIILPVLATLISDLAQALLPALSALISGPLPIFIGSLVGELHPVLMAIAPLLTLLATLFGQVLDGITPLMAPLFGLAVGLIRAVSPAVVVGFKVLAAGIEGVSHVLVPVIGWIANLVNTSAPVRDLIEGIAVAWAGWKIMTSVVGWVQSAVGVVGKLWTSLSALLSMDTLETIALYAMTAAETAASIATGIFATVMTALDAAMDANPIGTIIMLVVTALAALAGIVYEVVEHWRGLWTGIKAGMEGIATAALWLWHNVFDPVWQGIEAGALFLWHNVFDPMWQGIKAGFNAVATVAMWLWHNIFEPVWNGIKTAAQIAIAIILTTVITPFVLAFKLLSTVALFLWHNVLDPVWHGIAAGALWLWHNAIEPAVTGIKIAFTALETAALWLWHNVLDPVWHGIEAGALWLWHNVISPVVTGIKIAFQDLENAALWMWHNVFTPVWNGLEVEALWFWHNIIQPVVSGVKIAFQDLENAALWMWHNVFTPVWSGIESGAMWLWHNAIEPAVGGIKTALQDLENAAMWLWHNVFDPVWQGIEGGAQALENFFSGAWNDIKSAFSAPIKWIVDLVYNGAIVPVWNGVVGTFGGPTINTVNTSGWATGGSFQNAPNGLLFGPGTGTSDSILARVSRDEYIVNAADTRKNLQALEWANSGGLIAPVLGYASGGQAGSPVPGRSGWVYDAPTKGAGAIPRIPDGDRWIQQAGTDNFKVVDSATGIDVTTLVPDLHGASNYTQHGADPGLGGAIAGVTSSAWHAVATVVRGAAKIAAEGVLLPLKALADSTLGAWHGSIGPMSFNVGPKVAGTVDNWINNILNYIGGQDAKQQQQMSAESASSASAANIGPAGPNTPAGVAQTYALFRLPSFGWGIDQMQPLINLWNQESGWNSNAVNPSSGAYGIPQALGHGHPYNLGDYKTQIDWGLEYIKGRYGSPAAAWAHEVANNWYASGGLVGAVRQVPHYASGGFAAGLALVGENGPELADFGSGARIYSSGATQGALRTGSGGRASQIPQVHVHLPERMVLAVGDSEFDAYLDGRTAETLADVIERAGRK